MSVLGMSPLLFIFYLCVVIGLVFNGLGMVGLLRFPDVYTRLHAATKCTTFGSIFLGFSVMGYGLVNWVRSDYTSGVDLTFFTHTVAAVVAILLTNPTGAHALARASHRSTVKPEVIVVDRLEEYEEEKKRGKTGVPPESGSEGDAEVSG